MTDLGVGADRIRQSAVQGVSPHSWIHESAEQRMPWFTAGYEQDAMATCDTFAVSRP